MKSADDFWLFQTEQLTYFAIIVAPLLEPIRISDTEMEAIYLALAGRRQHWLAEACERAKLDPSELSSSSKYADQKSGDTALHEQQGSRNGSTQIEGPVSAPSTPTPSGAVTICNPRAELEAVVRAFRTGLLPASEYSRVNCTHCPTNECATEADCDEATGAASTSPARPVLDSTRIREWMAGEGYDVLTLSTTLKACDRAVRSLLNHGSYHGEKLVVKLAKLMECDYIDLYCP